MRRRKPVDFTIGNQGVFPFDAEMMDAKRSLDFDVFS
jgi:hypothetical protein